ncbi:hypothetical protein B0G81_1700 [Paraburkholderia sp. BL6665CI2N2]|nr:hypothetical protein B0G81_1700 [Paraburkholderia sp. BL6665CI2N2]
MKQRRRIYYSETQKALVWERWRKGESLQKIAQLFDRNHSSVLGILAETGGIQPPQRYRSRWALTLEEREEISRGLCQLVEAEEERRQEGASSEGAGRILGDFRDVAPCNKSRRELFAIE